MAVDAESLFQRGREAADRGNYDYAISLFRDVLRMDPTHRNSRITLRGCEMQRFVAMGGGFKAKLSALVKGLGPYLAVRMQKPAKAIETAENFLVNDPTNVAVLTRSAKALEKLGHIDAAVDTMEFARQRHPENINILRYLGELLNLQGQYDKSVLCFQEILKTRPQDRNAGERMRQISAESHLKRSKMDQGQSYRESIRDVKGAEKLEREGRMSVTDEERVAEITDARKKVEADPGNAELHHALGDACFRAEHYQEAEVAYKKAFEIGKKWPARERLGDAHLRLLEAAEKKIVDEAKDLGAPHLKAKAREAKQKRLEFAIKEYEFRRKQHPTDLNLAFQLGKFYGEAGGMENIQRATQQFQAAVNNPRLKQQAQLMLGLCFEQNPKTLDMAREQFEKSLESVEDHSSIKGKNVMYELGKVNEKLGDKVAALGWYKKIFSVDAAFRDVAKKIQELG